MKGALGDMLEPLSVLIGLAATIDRGPLAKAIAIQESDLGSKITEMMFPQPEDKKQMADGLAMLKLTAFYLDELHKFFPTSGEKL